MERGIFSKSSGRGHSAKSSEGVLLSGGTVKRRMVALVVSVTEAVVKSLQVTMASQSSRLFHLDA